MADIVLELDHLANDEWAEIINVTGPAPWRARMAELGLRANAPIRMLRRGCPCVVQVGGVRLCLRCADGGQIVVRPISAPAALSEVA